MIVTFDPNDPGIGVPDLGEPPIDDTPPEMEFPGEEVDPEAPIPLDGEV